MTILQRYVLREMNGPLALGLVVFTFVFLIGQMFKLTELLLGSDVPAALAGELILLLLPGILSITIPMALLVAILLGVGRLAADREILAIRTSGINLIHICVPIIGLAILLTALMTYANQRLIPYLNRKGVDLQMQLRFHVLSALAPGVPEVLPSSGPQGDTLFFYDHRDQTTGDMRGITMRMEVAAAPSQEEETTRTRGRQARTTETRRAERMARKGASRAPAKAPKKAGRELSRVEKEREKLLLAEQRQADEVLVLADRCEIIPKIDERVLEFHLTSGSLHFSSASRPGSYDVVRFDSLAKGYVPDFSDTRSAGFGKAPREMTIRELQAARKKGDRNGKFRVEFYQRFSVPLACIAFALIAIPLAVYARPTGKAIAFAISFLLILLYYGLLNYGIAVARTQSDFGPFAVFLPNLLLASVGSVLLYRMVMK